MGCGAAAARRRFRDRRVREQGLPRAGSNEGDQEFTGCGLGRGCGNARGGLNGKSGAWHRPTCNNMLVNFRAAFDLDECGDEARLAWKTLRAPQLKGRSCGKIGKRALLHREESPGDVIAEG